MTIRRSTCCLLALVVAAIIGYSTAMDYFTAAVFEHHPKGDWRTDTADYMKRVNLQYYERAAAKAKEEDADLILYPEYGIVPHFPIRLQLREFLEPIPDPKQVRVTPCDDEDQFSGSLIIVTLSCIAKNNQIAVVANMGERESCVGQPGCPEDGEFHYNVNVFFDKNGQLSCKYRKERLFYEFGFDLPREEQDPLCQTDFGNFAMFISFDINYKRMAEVSRTTDVDAVLLSTYAMNLSPYYTAIQRWQSWAMGNNATLLAANVQGVYKAGSGIYRGLDGSIVSAFNPDGIPKLIVATVPKRHKSISSTSKIFLVKENDIEEWQDNRRDLPAVCSTNVLGNSNATTEYRCRDDDVSNYTLQRLSGPSGIMELCHGDICCRLEYSADSMDESYYFGAFNGIRTFFTRYFFAEENCFLARCDDVNGSACRTFPMTSNTIFQKISMTARHISTSYVYPSLMSSEMRLVPAQDWTFTKHGDEASIEYDCNDGIPLLQTTLLGRVYNNDPPYVR